MSALNLNNSKQNRKPNKCAVCEKNAFFYHYDVPSCNGCKHFFRRSIIENKIYSCLENSNCLVENGIKCRACRLSKCLNAGMNKLLVQQLALKNKLNKQNDLENNNKKLSPSIIPTINKNCEITKILSELINVENKKFYIRNSRYGISVEFMFKRKLDDFLDKSTANLLNLYQKFEVI
uniref:Nuclear receptor domain-containing protein n=1 Tax=Meloidogyne enterolobii TaxID=390850 RepID=A0A6V7W5X9_MELEN|nr:unnamed protein product [Meloidogyne enterolobii]